MKVFVSKLRDIVFLWGTFSAVVTGAAAWYMDCEECLMLYSVEIGLAIITIVASFLIWYTLSIRQDNFESKLKEHEYKTGQRFDSIHISLIKSDVDRFWTHNRDRESLTEDEMSYVYMLNDKIKEYNINSFTQRKVESLMKKEINSN